MEPSLDDILVLLSFQRFFGLVVVENDGAGLDHLRRTTLLQYIRLDF